LPRGSEAAIVFTPCGAAIERRCSTANDASSDDDNDHPGARSSSSTSEIEAADHQSFGIGSSSAPSSSLVVGGVASAVEE